MPGNTGAPEPPEIYHPLIRQITLALILIGVRSAGFWTEIPFNHAYLGGSDHGKFLYVVLYRVIICDIIPLTNWRC